MKLAIIEPLGISEAQANDLQKKYLPSDVEMVYYNTPAADDAEKSQRINGADCVMLANTPFKETVIAGSDKLKFMSVAFTGVDHVAMDYCHAKEIIVSNCSGYANEAVSELVIGMALALYRKLALCDQAVRSGKTRAGLLGLELSGKTFGIIGAGAIGQATAKLAEAFGCEVYMYNRSPKDIEGVKFASLDEVLKVSDIISLHVPLTNATKGMIGAAELSKMKKTAILINTARGPVVDNNALAKALADGVIAGAAIDVFDTEPPLAASEVLLKAPNALLAPHIGFATKEALVKRAEIAFQNVAKWLEGKPQNVM